MVSVKSLIPAGAAAVILSTTVFAADMPLPPIYQPPPPVVEEGGWYLRGDVGVGIQNFTDFTHSQTNPAFVWPASWSINQLDIQDTTILGFGVGYEFNNWLRFDVTGEYRTKAGFEALGSYSPGSCTVGGVTGTCFDKYNGNYSAAVFMANAYIDLGTWWCITPYVGGGVGGAYERITGLTDVSYLPNGTNGFGFTYNDSATWNFAWNVQAGLTYNVTNNFKIDFNWRYLNLGTPESAVVQCQNTTPCAGAFYGLKDITSQDFRIGFRWMLQPEAPAVVMPAPPPLLSRG